ncbi:Exosome complex component Rrp42 [Rhynchospora pubera]|uniref:Protein ECERIFERUM 7 n=1 Tax=Rhynchospora pubera TaxID=906938 RepID=A0AAV8HG26_9POAL|nr:Exosome complex component Rrp42 [Rhynchospora pubera]
MEQRWANTSRLTINEKQFIEEALRSEIRVDGRRLYDYRRLTIKFGREDGSSEVQLGETHVMAFVTGQLMQPYRDRPNEGTLAIFTEFSPMADPSFEPGRPGEAAIELGRVIDRGLRESRAVDMESLCVVAGKSVWAIRVDLHIIDNGGNLIDAANIAALSALSTFRRPECSVGGDDNQEIIVHDPEVRDPIPLTIHHFPIAVTFAFFHEGNTLVIDPHYKEEAVSGVRMTVTVNSNGDVCAIQKAGGEGILSGDVMRCLRIASLKASEMTTKIKAAVETYNAEVALKKVKRHPSLIAQKITVPDVEMKEASFQKTKELSADMENSPNQTSTSLTTTKDRDTNASIGRPLNWDPYSSSAPAIVSSSTLPELVGTSKDANEDQMMQTDEEYDPNLKKDQIGSATGVSSGIHKQNSPPKSLKDAVKPKHKRKKNAERGAR